MLKQYFALLLTILLSSAVAQNNLIVLTEKGSLFKLFVNDAQINDSAQSEVAAANLFGDTCAVRMIFADKNIAAFDTKVLMLENGKSVSKKEFTYSLAEEKGKRKLNFISVNFIQSDTTIKAQSPETKMKKIFTDLEKQKQEQNRLKEIYPAPANCTQIISDSLLKVNLKLMRDNHTEINRVKDGKWFVSNHCINAKQLILLLAVFDRRDSKIKIAEFSYDYMEGPGNFLEVVEVFKFESDKEDLKKFYAKRIEK